MIHQRAVPWNCTQPQSDWAFIEARLQHWTPADCASTFPDEADGKVYEVPRSWVIYPVLEHDLHHVLNVN